MARTPKPSLVADFVASLREGEEAAQSPSLEELFTSADYFGVTTATPLQRAVCRVADGVPLGPLAGDPVVREAFSSWTDTSLAPDLRAIDYKPDELIVLAAVRCGKTRMAGAQAVRMSQTCDLTGLTHGETPCIPIVSVRLKQARIAFRQIVGTVLAQPKLRALLIGEPTADTITLRHPTGRPVAIQVTAGSAAGDNLISQWLAGIIFDEAPRMDGSDDGAVVNLDDMLASIQNRIRPGAQIIEIGSPWAPTGPIFAKVAAYHGKPSRRLVVVRGKGPWLNPSWWTPARVEKLRTSDKPEDRYSYRTDCEADFADPEEGLFASAEMNACTRSGGIILPPESGHYYVGSIDAATRGNAWTLTIKTRSLRPLLVDGKPAGHVVKDVIAGCWQWQGSRNAPLDPGNVFRDIAEILNPKDIEKPRYSVKHLAADQWSFDTLAAIARQHGLALILHHLQGEARTRAYLDAQVKMSTRSVEIPPDEQFRADLLGVRKRVTQDGLRIVETLNGAGRHCDYAPAFIRVLAMACPEPARIAETAADAVERKALEADLRDAKRERRAENGKWWQQNPFSTGRRGPMPKPPI